MKTATKTARGFQLRCLNCGTSDGTRYLYLDRLDMIGCSECQEDFSVEDLRAAVADATRLLAWIDAAPLPPAA